VRTCGAPTEMQQVVPVVSKHQESLPAVIDEGLLSEFHATRPGGYFTVTLGRASPLGGALSDDHGAPPPGI
jgi:hypothetical protein